MKKFSYFLGLCAAVCCLAAGFVSCSDDDGPGSSADLIGVWEIVSSEGWEKEDGEIIGEWNDTYANERIEFKEDGTYVDYYGSGNRWSVDYAGTWKYKGGKIYEYDDEGDLDDVLKVTKLTDTTLVLESSYKEREDGTLYEGYNKDTYRKIGE